MENGLATSKLVYPCPLGTSSQVCSYKQQHHHACEVVALMDVPDGEHMLLQNLQIFGSSQGTVLGEEEKTPSTVISAKNAPYHYTLRVFHSIDYGFSHILMILVTS